MSGSADTPWGRLVVVLLLVAAPLLLGSTSAAQVGERITAHAVDATIQSDGALSVVETITYDFGDNERHGIERQIVTREPANDDQDRVYRLSGVSASSATGAPAGVRLLDGAESTTIRVGDPDVTISGRQRYELRYVLRGLLNSFDDHDELFWEATGTNWEVPRANLTVTVRAPDGVQRVACFAGDPSSKASCDLPRLVDATRAEFRQGSLHAGEGLTVVVGLAKGVVTVPPPVLEQRQVGPWQRPPTPASFAVAGAAVLLTAAGGGLLWWRYGRDRAYVGLPLGLGPAPGQAAAEEPVPIGGGPEPAVAFTPPKGVRPGLAGVLLREKTAPVQVSATIVDLAVRGYLRIEELPDRDWRLTWLGTPQPGDELAGYERMLLDALFQGRATVEMSQLRNKFARDYRSISRELADEAHRTGWFRRRPRAGGAPAFLLGCLFVALWVVFPFSGIAGFLALMGGGWSAVVVVFGLLVAAVIAVLVWRAMPSRTAAGRAMWAQVVGFRQYLATAEAEQLRHEEAASVFSRYLPLAMVFGLTKRWAAVFAALAAAQGVPATVGWYYGFGGAPVDWGSSLDDFGRSSGSVLTSTPGSSASGGSGFSGGSVGGGGGGGGGGSW